MIVILIIGCSGREIHRQYSMLKINAQKATDKAASTKCPQCRSDQVRPLGAMDNPVRYKNNPRVHSGPRIKIKAGMLAKNYHLVSTRYQMKCTACGHQFVTRQIEPDMQARVLPRDY